MENEKRSKLVLKFGHDKDGVSVWVDGYATIAEIEAALESLGRVLDELHEMQESEFLKQMEMAYKDMVKGE